MRNVLLKLKYALHRISENAYLMMFILLVSYRFLNTTQLLIEWETLGSEGSMLAGLISGFLLKPQYILGIIAVCRYLFAEKYELKSIAAALILVGIALFASTKNEASGYMLIYFLLLVGAKDNSARKLISIYTVITGCFLLMTILASQVGLIENFIWQEADRNIRIAFGFNYPTDFAAHVFFLSLCYWFLRGERLTYAEAGLTMLLGVFLYMFCEARFSTVMLIGLSIVMMYCRYQFQKGRKNGRRYRMNTIWSCILVWMPILCALSIHMLSALYTASVSSMEKFNAILSNRLSLVKKAIDIYGFHLWGSEIPMMGNGGKSQLPDKYFYIDSSYLQLSLLYGIVLLAVFLFLLFWAGECAREKEQWILLWILAFAAVHGLFEQHLTELEYFPFLLVVFADMQGRVLKQKTRKKKVRRQYGET